MYVRDFIKENNAQNEDKLHDQSNDSSKAELTDTRKTRLTLEQINRLRVLNDVKIAEYQENIKKIKQQFATPVESPQ